MFDCKEEFDMSFPKGFLIGASTAAHQVEGNNIHSDYWAQEQLPHSSFTEPRSPAAWPAIIITAMKRISALWRRLG